MFVQCVCSRNNVFVKSSRTTIFTSNHHHKLYVLKVVCSTPELNGFTVDYLKNKCGLSPESALKASKHIVLKSTAKPDLVLSLFKNYGLTDAHISKLIICRPTLLTNDPDGTLKPKFDFFDSIGISGPDLGDFLVKDPNFLMSSLKNRIIPSINYLRSLVDSDEDIARILKRSRWGLYDAEAIMGPNIAILRNHGVPKSIIKRCLFKRPLSFFFNSDNFKEVVLELKEMGVSPSSVQFIDGLNMLLVMSKSTLEGKLEVFRSFGWTADEVLYVFKKRPFTFANSAKKIKLTLDFFMNTQKWNREDIARNPNLISHSLEKRIIPRCCVLQILLSKNLINEKGVSALKITENEFLEKYVTKYNQEIPDLLNVYQSKLGTQQISTGSEDGLKMGKA